MKHCKLIGIAHIALGLILLFFGFLSALSSHEQTYDTIWGYALNTTITLLVVGSLATVIGLLCLHAARR